MLCRTSLRLAKESIVVPQLDNIERGHFNDVPFVLDVNRVGPGLRVEPPHLSLLSPGLLTDLRVDRQTRVTLILLIVIELPHPLQGPGEQPLVLRLSLDRLENLPVIFSVSRCKPRSLNRFDIVLKYF